MRRLLHLLITSAIVVGSYGLTTTTAVAAPKKSVTVTLDGVGVTSQWEFAEFSGAASCQAGAINQQLAITVTQGSHSGSTTATSIICDGKKNRFSVKVRPDVGVEFEVGNAWVEARLTVHDPKTGSASQPATDANFVWIRPSGKITPVWPAVINKDGTMTVTADAVCRGPWVVNEVTVDVRQPGDPLLNASRAWSYPDVPCDAKKHRLTFTLTPPEGKKFVPRASNVQLSLGLEDPVEFDPVDQWWWGGTVSVVRR